MSRICGPAFQTCYLADALEPALGYWTEVLGIGPFFVLPPRRFERLSYRGTPTDERDIIADVALGYTGDMQIEIIVPGPAPSTYRDFLAAGHKGVHHLGMASRDYDRQRASALDAGLTVAMEGASSLTRFAYLEGDPAQPGTIVELVEMNPVIEDVFARIKTASVGWDGRDPIRQI